MKPVLIFRHIECEGPGYLGDFLTRHHRPYRVLHIDEGEAVPPGPDDCAGLVFLGGPMSVNDDLPWIAPELALIRDACAAGIPVLGHCLGGQLIARALGAPVTPAPTKEIGWHEVRCIAAPEAVAIPGLPPAFQAFHWHGEGFALPDGATRLMASEYGPHQAFAKGNALALQCHVEVTGAMVREWARRYAADLRNPPTDSQPGVQSADEFLADLPSRIAALHGVADRIYEAWCARLPV